MTGPLLFIDANFLCHRAWHAMGGLSFGNNPTGVIFGVLRDVTFMMDKCDTENVAFCFDSHRSKREDMLVTYKSTRKLKYKDATKEERDAMKGLRKQIQQLHEELLPRIGFRNVFCEEGYEADDLIAQLCLDYSQEDITIVSSDKDLYQLLSGNIEIWNPASKKTITLQSFYKTYGIYPTQWATVKAIAGCATDDVPGLKGIGDKLAAKFVSGKMKPECKAHKLIVEETKKWKKNLKLVSLPLPGLSLPKLRENRVTKLRWEKVMDALGMKSLRAEPPIPSRQSRLFR